MNLRAIHQFLRVKRYLKKVRLIAQRQFPEGVDTHVEDEVYAFFLNCHHLQYWVQKDSALNIDKGRIDKFVYGTECLIICGFLANAQKHYGLDRDKFSRKSPLPTETPDLVYPLRVHVDTRSPGPAKLGLETKIKSDSGELDYLDLAEQCFAAWKKFFLENGAPDIFYQD